jgi:hypothetical protein
MRSLLPLQVQTPSVDAPRDPSGACASFRPDWSGDEVSALSEALLLFQTPAALVLLLASALVLRFRSAWGALAVFVGWSLLVSAFTFFDPTGGTRTAAMAEGCVGSPTLFIAIALGISVGLILYTGQPEKKESD